MPRGTSPTLRKRRLVGELRRLREAAELTIEEVGERLECSASKISRIETGRVGVTPRDVRDMLAAYGADERTLAELVQLAREARRKAWWDEFGDLVPSRYVGFEADAESVRTYQGLMIPGLLQHEGYTRALIADVLPDAPPDEVDRRVRLRTARQALLVEQDPLALHVVVDEAALHRRVGGTEVMRGQLRRLREVGKLDNVTVQVTPFTRGGHAAMDGPFVLLSFAEQSDADLVYLESARGDVYLEQPSDVARYSDMFARLAAASLDPTASAALIERVARELLADGE
ncbi:helix-turn-helix transcriptional regulator [Actinosynnema sp. NPDC047251]|uniref:Transcriptional regulator, XRE family n=1 Tax=Saccharothrix espanaensis (strain ATCC 51144 / DSM 44229 / JCM 9112 / NBRC 15066 / NRRL 15764) TaxID=1179773 RepID=K0KBP3_SACES|nr:helix-turn-helix transcriptional regulator [Saccharothrix espanaensis]CCH34048.1 Transcriptional regulator, XRE family [Saccharothrix espanaensis DSM 44229]